jgi:hypothetical protein
MCAEQADLGHTSQIIMNLTTNAIKFALGSEVRVSVLVEPQAGASRSVLRVDVADSGAGLTPEECERIFKPFERAPPEKARACVRAAACWCWLTICACACAGRRHGARAAPLSRVCARAGRRRDGGQHARRRIYVRS